MELISGYLFFAFLAAFFWSAGNILDKAILSYHIEDPEAVTFFSIGFTVVFALVLLPLGLVSIRSPEVMLAMIVTGSLYMLPVYFYMSGLSRGEVTRITPVMELTPVFTAVIAAFLINEILDPMSYVGILLSITGAVIVSSERFGREFFHLETNRAFWTILAGTAFFAVYSVMTKWVLGFANFWNVFFWSRIGSALPLTLFLAGSDTREEIFSIAENLTQHRTHYLGVSELLNSLGLLAQTVAISLGPVAIVKTASSVQALMVLVMAIGAKKLWDYDLGDGLSSREVAVKASAGGLIIVGIYLTQI